MRSIRPLAVIISIWFVFALVGTSKAMEFEKPRIGKKPVRPVGEIKTPDGSRPSAPTVECTDDYGCPRGTICGEAKRCIQGCREDNDCPRDDYCSEDYRCVECLQDLHCPDGNRCDDASYECVECLQDMDCGPGQKCDQTQRKCVSP